MYEVRFDKNYDFGRIMRMAIFLFRNGKEYIAEPLVFRELTEVELIVKPTFETRSEQEIEQFFRAFLNAAESIGIKSEGEARLMGLLEAKEAHLQDLRALVTIPAKGRGKTLAGL